MADQELVVFSSLLREAYFRATGEVDPPASLTESQANTLAQVLFDKTGRSISGRTLRTYFRNATNAGEAAKVSNPSPYHLETLARYVLQVASDHNNENDDNHSIWFQYKQAWNRRSDGKPILPIGRLNNKPKKRRYRNSLLLILLLIFGSVYWRLFSRDHEHK